MILLLASWLLAGGWLLAACLLASLLGCSIIWFDLQCVQCSTVFRQNEKGKREKEGKGLVTGKKEYTQSVSQSVSRYLARGGVGVRNEKQEIENRK